MPSSPSMSDLAPPPSLSRPPPFTAIEVVYPTDKGRIGLRGSHAPLSWEHTEPPVEIIGDRHLFRVAVPPGEVLDVKVVRNDDDWAAGRNYALHPGDHLTIEPSFDAHHSRLVAGQQLGDIAYDVLLPPSYDEQPRKRYPVLYALDGQSLWSTSSDPYGVWSLERTLDELYDLGAVAEMIVVAVHTGEARMDRLTPVPDPAHGGGMATAFLEKLTGELVPAIDAAYRTRTGREATSILGSSLGGLFAFWAAWSRPEVFGQAACLSSSFWWANRWPVRLVQAEGAPDPRPEIYLDSGAARDALEQDIHARDGFHHTRSMFRALVEVGYTPGEDLHRLVFTGATHDAASWAARSAIPLQLLFPPEPRRPRARILERVAAAVIP